MNRARQFLENAAGRLDLPADVLAGVPRMEMTGFREFSIEPHQGLVEYEREQISISSDLGRIRILGSGLTIKLMNRQRITVCGNMAAVVLGEGHFV